MQTQQQTPRAYRKVIKKMEPSSSQQYRIRESTQGTRLLLTTNKEKLFFLLRQSSSVAVKKLCCLCYCRFQDMNEGIPEQPGLISYLTLL